MFEFPIDEMNNETKDELLAKLLKDHCKQNPVKGVQILTGLTIKFVNEMGGGLYSAISFDNDDKVLSGVFVTIGEKDTETMKACADKIDEEAGNN